jgi:hypothetical protein
MDDFIATAVVIDVKRFGKPICYKDKISHFAQRVRLMGVHANDGQ